MATAIANPHELQELVGLLEQHGLHVPDDVTTVEELVRYLLISCKTKAATEKLRDAKAASERRQRGNPDAPTDDDDDQDSMDRALSIGQFSTAGDRPRRPLDDAELAKRLVDKQERFQKNPNFARPAY